MAYRMHIPQFFAKSVNAEVKELFASSAIANSAIAIVTIFEPIFLYSVLGFSITEVLWFMAMVYFLYVLLIPFGGKIASHIGYKHAIFVSIPFQIIYWFLLFWSTSISGLIWFAPFVFAIQKSLFWPAFHADMATVADKKQIGREFSVIYALIQLMFVAGPFVGGLISEQFGPRAVFIVASALYFCSFAPLFITKEPRIKKKYQFRDTLALYKMYPRKFLTYLGFGEELIVLTVWPIFIYIAVKDYQGTGLLVTLATLLSTVLALYIGKVTDSLNKRVLVRVGAFFSSLAFLAARIASGALSVFFIDSFLRTSKEVLFIPLSTSIYEYGKRIDPLAYVIYFEQVLAIGKFLAALLGVLIFAATGSFFWVFVVAALFSLLYMFE
jgi:MFS family permease